VSTDARAVLPLDGLLDATVSVPGSKSITNRALLCAALAQGTSRLDGVLFADDTEAMLDCLERLGITVRVDRVHTAVELDGTAGVVPAGPAVLDARMSGTTARFLAPLLACGSGHYVLDGAPQLRGRPMAPLLAALAELGALVEEQGEPGCLPVAFEGRPLRGGVVRLRGDVSSQFVSGLLMAAPLMATGLRVELDSDPVSRPYVALTAAVMGAFGAVVDLDRLAVAPGGYRARVPYRVEPDASSASYFLAAAAIAGGRVRVEGLGRTSIQGDTAFVDLLARMGAVVEVAPDHLDVHGGGDLVGIEADMSDISDTAPTLAAVAAFARTPTRVTGIGFVRGKESDRIGAVVSELRRCGIDATEERDGFTVRPGEVHGARVRTYDDHRIAMSFALLGLRVPGIEIEDPGCVAKTFPGFWEALDALRPGSTPGRAD